MITALLLGAPVQAEKIHLCLEDKAIEPFSSGADGDKSSPGLLPERINKAAQAINIEVRYTYLPWKRCINVFKSGEVDGLLALIRNKERERWAVFPPNKDHKLWSARYKVFVARNSKLEWDGKTFKHLKDGVSAPLGYIANIKLREMGVHPTMTISPKSGLLMVARHRLDGFIIVEDTGWFLAKEAGIDHELQTLPIPFMEENLHLAVSQRFYDNNKAVMNALWQKLDEYNSDLPQGLLHSTSTTPENLPKEN